jgi:hypothetical protein
VRPPAQAKDHEPSFRVIVWPEGPEGTLKPSRYSVVIQGRSHSYSRVADGSYVIPDIPPGHYKLVSVAWAESEYLGEGDTTFDVTNADVVLRLTLGGLAEIQGVAKTDKTRTGIPDGVILWIQSQESGAQGSRMDAAGKFAFGRVLPGEYRFSVLKNPEGIVLRSVRCGDAAVTQQVPLRVDDRQKIADCEVILGYEFSASNAAEPVESASSLIAQFNSATMSWRQFEIAEKIVALHDNSVLPELDPWLSNDDMQARGNAAFIFGRLGNDRGFQVIKNILSDRSTRRTVRAIDDAGQASPELQIRDDRYYTVHLLGELKDPRAVPVLVPLLSDDDVNWAVPWSLGAIGDESAIPPLVATLRNKTSDMRVLAIDALVQLNAKEALPELHTLLDDNQKIHFDGLGTVAESAKAAIAKLEAHPAISPD